MKKIIKVFAFVLILITCLTALSVLFACEKNSESTIDLDKIENFKQAEEDKALYIQWLSDFDNKLPTAIFFHGEQSDVEFTLDLDKSVYTEEVFYQNENINVDTIGIRAQGLKNTADNSHYKIAEYWEKVGNFNVAIFHYEAFIEDAIESNVTKILSKYNSRYFIDDNIVDCNFNYSLSEIASAMIIREFDKLSLEKEEVRFIGNGVGATLALTTATCMYKALYSSNKAIYLPSRVTMCDAYLGTQSLSFEIPYIDNLSTSDGVIGVTNDLIKRLKNYSVAIEFVESAQVVDGISTYAYDVEKKDGAEDIFNSIKDNVAYLLIEQSYTNRESFNEYKNYKRIALDWYAYSIIGSDDSFTRNSGEGEYAVGYPHSFEEHRFWTDNNTTNWGNNHTRPILNDRAVSNDYNSSSGASRGFNFGISAWTPTVYIKALSGTEFYQKKAVGKTSNNDVHGTLIFEYERYVLATFSSENRQVSDNKSYTIICGYVYADNNGNNKMDDGLSGVFANNKLLVTIMDSTQKIEYVSQTAFYADDNGFYCIRINDADVVDDKVNLTVTQSEGSLIIDDFSALDDELYLIIEVLGKKGYVANNKKQSGIPYNTMSCNRFEKAISYITLENTDAHGIIIANCLMSIEKDDE